jgi:hypothetical protein
MMRDPNLMVMYVIYEKPLDFPQSFVVRKWYVSNGVVEKSPLCILATSLETARKLIPPGLYNLGRENNDDPAIREVWI